MSIRGGGGADERRGECSKEVNSRGAIEALLTEVAVISGT